MHSARPKMSASNVLDMPFSLGHYQVAIYSCWLVPIYSCWLSACSSAKTRPIKLLDPSSYPLVMTNSLLLKMAIEIVSFPIKNGDFP